MTILAGGVFAREPLRDEHAELRDLVDDLGRRAYEARLGQRGVPDQFDAELWRNLENTGLARLTSTPDAGAGPREAAIVLYGIAHHAGAVPLAENDVLAGWLSRAAGIMLPVGPATVAIADAPRGDLGIGRQARSVPWARACTSALVAIPDSTGLRVGMVEISEENLLTDHNLAGEPRDTLTFDMTADQFETVDPVVGDELVLRGAWSRCVQTLGALDAAAVLTAKHTRDRVQFGRSLSAFQAVQQALAGMAGDIEAARAAVECAVDAVATHGFDSTAAEYAVSVAKATIGRTIGSVTATAHQLHGAIGVTREHPLWLFTLRAQSWSKDFGTTKDFARRLGRATLTADDPWDLVTAI